MNATDARAIADGINAQNALVSEAVNAVRQAVASSALDGRYYCTWNGDCVTEPEREAVVEALSSEGFEVRPYVNKIYLVIWRRR